MIQRGQKVYIQAIDVRMDGSFFIELIQSKFIKNKKEICCLAVELDSVSKVLTVRMVATGLT